MSIYFGKLKKGWKKMEIDYREEKAEVIILGRNEALQLLSLNTKNRGISESRVATYAQDIERGDFKFNGDGIVLSQSGVLLDGQHRLTALSRTNKKIKVVLVTGIEDKVMSTIDMGAKRTTADVIKLDEIPNSVALAAMSKLVMEQFGLSKKYVRGMRKVRGEVVSALMATEPTTSEVIKDIENNLEEYQRCILFSEALYASKKSVRLKGLSVSSIAAYLFLFSKIDNQGARSYLREILTGNSERDSNAAILLRNKLINIALRRESVTKEKLRDLMTTGFKKYINDESTKTLIAKRGSF